MVSLTPGTIFQKSIDWWPIKSVVASTMGTPSTAGNAAGFFTGDGYSMDRQGAQDDTNWTADTYKTIVNLTATKSGLLTGFVGPTLPTAADTCTIRVTVDGVAATLVGTAQENAARIIFGPLPAIETVFTTANRLIASMGAAPSDGITLRGNAGTVIGPMDALFYGCPVIRFNASLLIEAKISVNLTTTTNVERRCGVYYLRNT